jgi:uncharacterized protein YggU (UPF0235/DUF167 family)
MAHVTISVRVQTRARKDELATFVTVSSWSVLPRRLLTVARTSQLLADRLGVSASRVAIFRGHRFRDKLVRVVGVDQAAVDAALGA